MNSNNENIKGVGINIALLHARIVQELQETGREMYLSITRDSSDTLEQSRDFPFVD